MARILSVFLNVQLHDYFPVSAGHNYFDCMLGLHFHSCVTFASKLFFGHPTCYNLFTVKVR